MVRNVTGGALVLAAPQQISSNTLPPLERQIDDALSQRVSGVDFDLSGTQMIDSAGLNWLLTTQSRLTTVNIPLRLVEVPSIVVDVLHATRLESRFSIVPPESEGGVSRA